MTDTPASSATVTTDRPSRYGKQLTSHMARKVVASWDADAGSGSIEFDAGSAHLTSTDGGLAIAIRLSDGDHADDAIAHLEDVVGRHLVRFGARDELVVQWTRADGSEGTRQENTEAGPNGGIVAPSPADHGRNLRITAEISAVNRVNRP